MRIFVALCITWLISAATPSLAESTTTFNISPKDEQALNEACKNLDEEDTAFCKNYGGLGGGWIGSAGRWAQMRRDTMEHQKTEDLKLRTAVVQAELERTNQALNAARERAVRCASKPKTCSSK